MNVFKLFAVALCLSGCSASPGDSGFRSGGDALGAYGDFLHEVQRTPGVDAKGFSGQLCRWFSLRDTVFNFLQADSLLDRDAAVERRFYEIHDSVKVELLRLCDSWKCSYLDVIAIRLAGSEFRDDRELRMAVTEAEPFFLGLDSVAAWREKKPVVLARYRSLLGQTLKAGFSSREDMMDFIRREDVAFRSFLLHLHDLQGESILDITRDTEAVCQDVFAAARHGKIPARDALVFMAMRTNRRLLLNARLCATDINRRRMDSPEQVSAYLWMIIQPFVSVDAFSMACLTDAQLKVFDGIARGLPRSVKFAESFGIDQKTLSYLLPRQLLKMYVSSL